MFMKRIIDQVFLQQQPTVVGGSGVSFVCWSRLVQTQKNQCLLKSSSSFLEASKSYLRHKFLLLKSRVWTQTDQSSLKWHWGPVSSAGFLLLLRPPQSPRVVLGEPNNVNTTVSHLKQWAKHCINHSDEGNGSGLKCGRCADHYCSKAAPESTAWKAPTQAILQSQLALL